MALIYSRSSLEDNYLAFYLSIVWYRQLTPEEAFRIFLHSGFMFDLQSIITPDMIAKMNKITSSKNFCSWDKLERTFKVNRYKIAQLLRAHRDGLEMQTAGKGS